MGDGFTPLGPPLLPWENRMGRGRQIEGHHNYSTKSAQWANSVKILTPQMMQIKYHMVCECHWSLEFHYRFINETLQDMGIVWWPLHSKKSIPLITKSMLILVCKSDCQPIFLGKKQGTYSLYANLWLVRPLIKNIHYSSYQYLSNVTFRASLAFQTREKFNLIFEFDLKGGK